MTNVLSAKARAIKNIVHKRGIRQLVHFTPVTNLSSILVNGLLTREVLEDSPILTFDFNIPKRLASYPNSISLSVMHPNQNMFSNYRYKKGGDWVVIELDPSILWEEKCSFYPCNASGTTEVMNKENTNRHTASAFREMFHKEDRAYYLQDNDPTDEQAEVLVFTEQISVNKFLRINAENHWQYLQLCQRYREYKRLFTYNPLFFWKRQKVREMAVNDINYGYPEIA
ncbi:DarT ssDNA thymidine ADP-ribosyltransferase family protein [Pelistega sp. MC2]|uniref:DarT ssDNA thymidine ADP-ribosyltransferase family protein n=1 Tax=Pelistega sp. MC2 TaxID=1720297 RepID=UPI0008D96A80|nr:DarT ssDNA thymidine ADP-ribosyltransferase family protein [Pelistega sp. MC2]